MMRHSMFGENVDSDTAMNDMKELLKPLSAIDNEALKLLLNNDSKMEEHIRSVNLEIRNKFVGQKEMIMIQNRSIAEFNLSYEPKLEQGRDNLKQLTYQIEQVRNSLLSKEEQLKSSKSALSSETALALLQTSAAEAEEDSEKLADMLYQKEIDIEEFLERFQDVRKRMHLRRVKAEKMVELVSQQNSRPLSGQQRRAAPPPPYPLSSNPFLNNQI